MAAKIAQVPRKIRDEYMDIICSEELIHLVTRSKKEDIKLNAVREGFDRTRGKPPVSVAMESHSSQITGTLVDLLSLLRSSNEVKQLPQPDQGVIEVKALPDGSGPEGT
jgi:hypothetical protein